MPSANELFKISPFRDQVIEEAKKTGGIDKPSLLCVYDLIDKAQPNNSELKELVPLNSEKSPT
jgi:hypothetical protein